MRDNGSEALICGLRNFFALLINQHSNLIGLGAHLFVKVPRPGDSEGTFSVLKSS